MRTLLVGINSKFIHTCLAIWYLKSGITVVTDQNIIIKEFSINDYKDKILSEIYKEKPEVLAFSCYIWNIEIVLSLSKELKKLLPDCIIILGGPEVSYDPDCILKEHTDIDFVLSGEGEELFTQLYQCLLNGLNNYKFCTGIAYREGNSVIWNKGFNLVQNLNLLKSPYTDEMMESVSNRIIYYESSRGCPFSCSYCISSTYDGVRYFSLERVKQDLSRILEYKPKLIKFVDRTFNCNKQRAKEILELIISFDCDTLFHFEAAADLFDDELMDILSSAKKGTIQLEIGIQTTNTQTLTEIDRVTDIDKLSQNVKKIISRQNIHVHVDLIAGLPFENLTAFINSFNEVYSLKPHQLQLGFLKLLKGSKLRDQSQIHGYSYREYAPYEVLANNYISFDDIMLLKDVEEVLERYYNSARFAGSLAYMSAMFSDAFQMYYRLSVYCKLNGYLDRPVSYRENIMVLYSFFKSIQQDNEELEAFRQTMVYDFIRNDSSCAIPESIRKEKDILDSSEVHSILQQDSFIENYLPDFKGLKVKQILKKVFLIKLDALTLSHELILLDYTKKDRVTGQFRTMVVNR